MKVLVTGANGFVGKNLCESLKNIRDEKDRREQYQTLLPLTIFEFDKKNTLEQLDSYCKDADFVFNLAGVNRPKEVSEFMKENRDFGEQLIELLEKHNNTCPIMLSSSIQASLDGRYANSPYGESKLAGEYLLFDHAQRTNSKALVYRFPNLYGKWCKPHYNSVVATFCDAIANNRPYTVSDPSVELELLYIDDLVEEMLQALLGKEHRCKFAGFNAIPCENGEYCYVPGAAKATLGEIVDLLKEFKISRQTLELPRVEKGSFKKKLYSTYLTYLDETDLAYKLTPNKDKRGSFTEVLKMDDYGQVSVNISAPGVVKGNHWHMSKWEKFLVVSGEALIKERKIGFDENGDPFPTIEHYVNGGDRVVVEMIPGCTHSITNLSDTKDLVTVMWANEIFDPANPDTYYEEV